MPAGVDAIRKIVVDAGDGYRKDYVAPGTVVGVDADGGLLRSYGGFIPKPSADDDEHRLIALAKVAAAWYCIPHYILRLETKRLTTAIGLGNLVRYVGDPAVVGSTAREISSAITQIGITIPRDGSDPVMDVQTWAGELDPMQVKPAMPVEKRWKSAGEYSSDELRRMTPEQHRRLLLGE
jgi:hypothetical protein